MSDSSDSSFNADRFSDVLADYLDRLNDGDLLDPEEIRRAEPELAARLIDALEAYVDVRLADDRKALGKVGPFELRRRIGRGGMGVVYEAWDSSMDRRIALKVLPSTLQASPRAVARFVREARLAGKLRHPNVVSVYGMGIEAESPYYAMEFIDGQTLSDLVQGERGGSLDSASRTIAELFSATDRSTKSRGGHTRSHGDFAGVAAAFAGAADGLEHAHAQGIVHRDVKPSNLIVDATGSPSSGACLRILDFGLARSTADEALTLSGDFLGTPRYMSPEQARAGSAIDRRADVYGLGASLYEILTGEPVFRGTDYRETLEQILSDPPVRPSRLRPDVPRDLETICLKCLEKSPDARYSSAVELADDLRRFAAGEAVLARPRTIFSRWAQLARPSRRYVMSGLVLAVVIALGISFLLRPSISSTRRLASLPELYSPLGVSRDGRHVAFLSWKGANLGVRDLTSQTDEWFTDNVEWADSGGSAEALAFSDDGMRLAFTWVYDEPSEDGTTVEIRVTDRESREMRTLARESGWLAAADWSPDGGTVLAVSSRAVYLIDVDSGARTRLREWPAESLVDRRALFSPDGRYVAVTLAERRGRPRDIVLLAADGTSEEPVVDHPADDELFDWSPDGGQLLFRTRRTVGSTGLYGVGILDGRAVGQPVHLSSPFPYGPVGFTADGAYYAKLKQTLFDAQVVSLDSTASELLDEPEDSSVGFVGASRGAEWSGDGERLAYRGTRSGESLLVVQTWADRSERVIGLPEEARRGFYLMGPIWSPDDRTLLLWRDGGYGLCAIDVETGTATRLGSPVVGAPVGMAWSPDGRWIYLRPPNRRPLVRWDVHGGDETVDELFLPEAGPTTLDVSPNGDWLVLFARKHSVVRLPAAGGEAVELIRFQEGEVNFGPHHPLAWLDNERVLFVRNETEIWRVDPGGEKTHIGDVSRRVERLSIHPEGNRLALTVRQAWSELWALENLLGEP